MDDYKFCTGELRQEIATLDFMIENLSAEIDDLEEIICWCYSKIHHISFSKKEDALMLDRIKLLLETGVDHG